MEKKFPGHQLADRLEALDFAFHQLAKTLHEAGQLDIVALRENLSSAEWIFQDSSQGTRNEVLRLSAGLEDMRVRALPPDHPERS